MNLVSSWLFVLACSARQDAVPGSAVAEQVAADATIGAEAFAHLVLSGPDGTTRGLRVVAAHVAGADAASRTEARAAADVLMGACPYNRSAVQLALVAQRVTQRHDGSTESPEVQAAWLALRDGITLHVALLDGFGVTDLRAPAPFEYLYDHPDVVVTRAQLDASDDPIGLTRPLVDQTRALVEGYDLATRQFIESAQLSLDGYAAGHWPLATFLLGWRAALEGLAPQIDDPATQADARALIELIGAFGQNSC